MLVIGLVLFFGIHLLAMTPLRAGVVATLGFNAYRGIFSLVSLAGLGLCVWGYSDVPLEFLFAPKGWARAALPVVMPLVFIGLAAANMPTHIRRLVRHPMLIAILLWSGLHLLANGERAASYLFGAFAAYCVVRLLGHALGVGAAGGASPTKPVAAKFDLMAVVGGLVVYAIFIAAHEFLFGVPVFVHGQ